MGSLKSSSALVSMKVRSLPVRSIVLTTRSMRSEIVVYFRARILVLVFKDIFH